MLTVEQLWAVYLASLVGLVIIAFVLSRVSKMRFGIGLFIAVLLASIITYMVAITNVDVNDLEQSAKNALQTLYWVIIIIIIIAFIIMFYMEWSARKHQKESSLKSEDSKSNSMSSWYSSMMPSKTKPSSPMKMEEDAFFKGLSEPIIMCDENGCQISELGRTRFMWTS